MEQQKIEFLSFEVNNLITKPIFPFFDLKNSNWLKPCGCTNENKLYINEKGIRKKSNNYLKAQSIVLSDRGLSELFINI